MANDALVRFVLEHNQRMSHDFLGPDNKLAREEYRVEHPTEVTFLKCMDGRLNAALMSNTPLGIIEPHRTIGGKFNLGVPYLMDAMRELVNYSIAMRRKLLVFVTYHYSKGDRHRGCRGFEYDTAAAIRYTNELRSQFDRVFGTRHQTVYAVQMGIETDDEAFILHGNKGEILDLSTIVTTSPHELRRRIEQLFPDMNEHYTRDIMPFVVGNIQHIAQVRASNRSIQQLDHKERILGIGRGFDWLHLVNEALLIGPYTFDIRPIIKAAAGILQKNLQEGRIPQDEGLLLLGSWRYRDESLEANGAREHAIYFADLAEQIICEEYPDLVPVMQRLVGTVNLRTRLFTPIEEPRQLGTVQLQVAA